MGFTEYYRRHNSSGNSELRLAQFKKAIGKLPKGDSAMLKHLGEHRLGQKVIKNDDEQNNAATRETSVQLSEVFKELPRLVELFQSSVATQQPILDKECTGPESQIQPELGPEGTQ
jgi:hypothetical protein